MSIEIRNLPYFNLATALLYSNDQSDESQTPQASIDYQGNTYRTGLPVFTPNNFEVISQPGNTFKVGDAVQKQVDGTYALAAAQAEVGQATGVTHGCTGVVTNVGTGAQAGFLTVTFNGNVVIGAVSGGRYETSLTPGSVYYLTSGVPGQCSTAFPASRTTYQPIFVALSTTSAYVMGEAAGVPVSQFLDLVDVPSTYAGQATKLVRVNAAGTALEFITAPAQFTATFVSLTDVPASYSGAAGKTVRVNSGGTGLVFVPSGPQWLAAKVLVASGAAAIIAATNWNAVTSGGIPAGAAGVILEAQATGNGPDNFSTGSGGGLSQIYIQQTATSPLLLLIQHAAAGGGDAVGVGAQGQYPLATDGSFYYSKTSSGMNNGWSIYLVGYYF